MKRHSALIAAALLVFVVLACNLGKKKAAESTNQPATNESSNSDATATGVIKEMHMAKDNGSGDPGTETNSFGPDDRTIHCVVNLAEPKAGMKMKFSWWIVEAEGSKNEKIRDIDYTTKAQDNIVHGHLTLPQDWPPGKYKVEVYVNGNLEKTVGYSVN